MALTEVGPECVADPDLGVGDLPEEEVRHPHLSARPDEEVGVGLAGRVEVPGQGHFVDVVGVPGVRQDVPELLRRSAVLVMTSAPETEGMPGIVIEAALSGVPVVATPAAGVADVVVPGKTGHIVVGDSAGELADAIAPCSTWNRVVGRQHR